MNVKILGGHIPAPALKRKVKIAHITDSHLCLCDGRDGARWMEHARARDGLFGNGVSGAVEGLLSDMVRAANEAKADAVVMTGDIIDFPSEKNIDALKKYIALCDAPVLYTLGNHDYTMPGVFDASLASRAVNGPRLSRAIPNDCAYAALDLGDLMLIGVDNTRYQIEDDAIDKLEADLARGLPTVICGHTPFFAESLYEPTLNFWRSPILCGLPEKYRFEGMGDGELLPSKDVTKRALGMLAKADNLVGALTGHVHFSFESEPFPGCVQLTTAVGAMGAMRILEIGGE